MVHRRSTARRLAPLAALLAAVPVGIAQSLAGARPAGAAATQLSWSTVVNNGETPAGSANHFNSYSQPSIDDSGVVSFIARTQGPASPVRGVFSRGTSAPGAPLDTVALAGGRVPDPNNSDGTFNDFPAFPRMGTSGPPVIAIRGQSTPVWTYSLDGTDTKVGTSGVYTTVGGALSTGASLLGNVPTMEAYSVPGAPAGTRFDQFPGAPAVDGSTIVFKGNYTDGGISKTGDYFRDLGVSGAAVGLIANNATRIPNQPAAGTVTFGATAPPSAAGGRTVFVGWDNENAPSLGGVYLANTAPSPEIETLAGIGEQVPGMSAADRFTNFGENLSFDGRFVAFSATWGSEQRSITLACPTDGNTDLLAFCRQSYPLGFTTTIPAHQGIFVFDTTTHTLHTVATTGSRFSDLMFWVFSGRPPGTGSGEEVVSEPARWRSSTFVAVSGLADGTFQAAFKATPVTGGSGIYLAEGPSPEQRIVTAVATGAPGTSVDPAAPAGSAVTAVGLERDGFRGRRLVIGASMLDPVTSESWAGVYVTTVPTALDVLHQSIAVTSVPLERVTVGSTYTVVATADSNLPVAVSVDSSSTSGACRVAGATVQFMAGGTCVVRIEQGGDDTFASATPVFQSMTVEAAPQQPAPAPPALPPAPAPAPAPSPSPSPSPSPTLPPTLRPAPAPTSLRVSIAGARSVYGRPVEAAATVTATRGAPTGRVQFAVDGAGLGTPRPVAGGRVTSPALSAAVGGPLAPGKHVVTATFMPDDLGAYVGSTASATHVVDKSATRLTLTVRRASVVASVAPVAPGAGFATGAVVFSLNGRSIGRASFASRRATLAFTVPPGLTQHVAAVYAGDVNFAGSSASTALHHPRITAVVRSKYARSRFGWYRSPVTVTFRCTTDGAPLVGRCPAPVRFTRSGAGRSVTRTILATDGGVATVVRRNIDLDLVGPTVTVTGVRDGATYAGVAPVPVCRARDALSGVASCVLTRTSVGTRTTYRATATDRAGNTRSVTGTYRSAARPG